MTTLNPQSALSLIESIIKQSQAEGVFVTLRQNESTLSRFSENQISQNLSKNNFKVTVTSYFGQQTASASTTELEPEAITATIQRAEALAKIAPPDPEWMPLLTKQDYPSTPAACDEATAHLSPLARGEIVEKVCSLARQKQVKSSGTLSTDNKLFAIGNSQGLFAVSQTTEADFSFTAKIEDGSSWGNLTAYAIKDLPVQAIATKTIERAIASRQPRRLEPGDYTVILEPAAMSSLLPWLVWNLDARAADEGRSFMSKGEGENRLGEQIFSSKVNIYRDSAHPLLQTSNFLPDGLSNSYLDIVRAGIVKNLSYSRYWAKKQGKEATGYFSPLVMAGENQTVADLIAQTEKGILITRAWYVRYVNPRTLEVTGMTRDGTFWIEEGKIAYPIKNLRFNQVLPTMLHQIESLSQVARFGQIVVPGAKVKNFHFSSITDSV